MTLLSHHLEKNIGYKDGEIFVKDKNGDPVYEGAHRLSVEGFLDKMKSNADFSSAFSEEKKGIGTSFEPSAKASPSLSSNQGMPREMTGGFEEFNERVTAKQEAEYIEKHGVDAYTAAVQSLMENEAAEIRASHRKQSAKGLRRAW